MTDQPCPLAELSEDDMTELVLVDIALAVLERSAEGGLRQWADDVLEKRKRGGSMAGLDRYWSRHMPGKAGDYNSCVTTLMNSRRHFSSDSAHRLCQWLHMRHTGKPAGHAAGESKDKGSTA